MRARKSMDPETYDRTVIERIRARSLFPESGCWEWQGFLNHQGYGQTSYRGRNVGVHRLSFLLHFGAIPDALQVLHKCDNRICWNPEHLWLGTLQDNLNDMKAKGRSHGQKRDACYAGHKYVEGSYYWRNHDGKGMRRQCKVCDRVRQRMRAGWTREQAEALPITPHGHRPVNGHFPRGATDR